MEAFNGGGENKGTIEKDSEQGVEIEKPNSKLFYCVKRWIGLGVLASGLYFGLGYKEDFEEKEGLYRDHIEHIFTQTDHAEIQNLKADIINIFGDYSEKIFKQIQKGDKIAFSEPDRNESIPKITGFNVKEDSDADNLIRYALPEKYKFYPKGWLNGEVDEICLVNYAVTSKNNNGTFSPSALFGNKYFSGLDGKTVLIFAKSENKAYEVNEKGEIIYISSEVLNHEFGHANDWKSDRSLNIKERYQMLIRVHERMTSNDAYSRPDAYHESFDNGTSEGAYDSTVEYWAEICASFFADAKDFKEKHPKDFDLVLEYIRKGDPTFDPFDENRGAFDTHTGKIKDSYLEK